MPSIPRTNDLEAFSKARYDLLTSIQAAPSQWLGNGALLDSLRSQGALAALELSSHQIGSCALNTLKKSAALGLNGGFFELDELRKSVLAKLQPTSISNAKIRPASKAYYKHRTDELTEENQQLKEDLWTVTRAFYKAMTNGRSYATDSGDPALVARCTDDERELRAMVSLAKNKAARLGKGANDA